MIKSISLIWTYRLDKINAMHSRNISGHFAYENLSITLCSLIFTIDIAKKRQTKAVTNFIFGNSIVFSYTNKYKKVGTSDVSREYEIWEMHISPESFECKSRAI